VLVLADPDHQQLVGGHRSAAVHPVEIAPSPETVLAWKALIGHLAAFGTLDL
jgi:hypothetical protein